MISLKKFIENTKGTKVDVTWANGRLKGQCVSLVQQYINQCLGQPMKARGNAVDWDESYVREGLGKKVSNPQYGDLVVYNPPYAGTYGHIAIYISSNTMYDQNNGSHDNRCAGYGKLLKGGVYIRPNANLIPDERDGNFLGNRGWLQFGDSGSNVEKICKFMYDMFPAYARTLNRNKEKLLGNYYGENIQAWIKEFQKRTGLEQDGCVGPITLAKLKEFGFKE